MVKRSFGSFGSFFSNGFRHDCDSLKNTLEHATAIFARIKPISLVRGTILRVSTQTPAWYSPFQTRQFAMDSSIVNDENVNEIYEKAEEYWSQASQDVDGMLGGFAHLHRPDIIASKVFLAKLAQKNILLKHDYALDCGAGIGRVTKHLLLPLFNKVDMEDVVEELVKKSDEYIGTDPKMGEKFAEGLQTFAPPLARYDLIWIQWVSGHLTDSDFIEFFKRCKEGLAQGGVIVLKDNLSAQEKPEFDSEDNSWTRPENLVLELFEKAGLRMVAKNLQTGFPKGMYAVKMFALKPDEE